MIPLIVGEAITFSTLNFILIFAVVLPLMLAIVILMFLTRRNTLYTADSIRRIEVALVRLIDAQIAYYRRIGMKEHADKLQHAKDEE